MPTKFSPVVTIVMFPCPSCEHNNRPSKKNIDCIKLWLQDELPECRKCGRQLRKSDFGYPTKNSRLLERARAALAAEGITT